MDSVRVDRVLEFALLCAGRSDTYAARFLGAIHLLKYVYLADLAYAEKHGGETFTGTPWRFHHFGPWSAEVFGRIAPTTKRLGAAERNYESKAGEDRSLWSLADNEAFDGVERTLPIDVALAVRRVVRKFGNDTGALLHFVYNTPPMLRAAPREPLVFSAPAQLAEPSDTAPHTSGALTDKQKKRRAERIKEARDVLRAKLAVPFRPAAAGPATPPPRYDEVFAEGLTWLDGLAGEPLGPTVGDMLVDESVWKSGLRGDGHDG